MSMQLFVPTFRVDECLVEIRECLEKGWTGLGFKTVEFEEKWKQYTGLPNAHFLNSATSGLHLAVKIFKDKLNWQEGDEIISTPLTFVSTNHAVVYERLTVQFADVDQYLCLDPEDVEKKITPRTRAVIFVGLGGSTGKLKQIAALCRKHKLILILDAAHMAGSRLDGENPGKWADVTVFSFQAVKNLPTADSGMICFSDPADDKRARELTWLGINKDTYARAMDKGGYKWRYEVDTPGYKYHGNSIMAAIGLVQLRYLEQDNAYRRQLARWYSEELSGVDGIRLIPEARDNESSRHLFIIAVESRNDLILYLNTFDIYPGVHYRDNTEYSIYAYAQGQCPQAHEMSEKVVSLPMHLRITRDEVKFIAAKVIDFVKGK